MKNKVLSPFPYYGGKAKMSPLICSLLDYENTSLYIEPYGGGCRTLLNKKTHEQEIYNDFGYGLTTFFNIMSSKEQTEQLISMLMENPPNIEQFEDMVLFRMAFEDKFNTSTNAILSSLALECYRKYHIVTFRELRKAINQEDYRGIIAYIETIIKSDYIAKQLEPLEEQQYKHYYKLYRNYWALVLKTHDHIKEKAGRDFDSAWVKRMNMVIPEPDMPLSDFYQFHREEYSKQRAKVSVDAFTSDIITNNEAGVIASDLEIAFAIFQLYYSSRDGMGEAWSKEKNQNVKAYYKAVANLRNISERMQNVQITQCDALDLIRLYRTYDNVMMYLDPSYLMPEDESKNLGKVYKMSYEYEDHEKILREITKPDTYAKILISNYDVDLYNTYLCDWEKIYYKTFTGVGSKKGNRRLEVLWKNY